MKTYEETRSDLISKVGNIDDAHITLKNQKSDDACSKLVDAIIEVPNKNKKAYVVIKGLNTLPAAITDVAKLFHIKDRDRKAGKKNYDYVIFCERRGNKRTAEIAHNYGITYLDSQSDFNSEIKRYFETQ